MWTHAHPFLPEELTAESIGYHGRLALFRSLNVGRAVALVGSGATAARGLPSWDALTGNVVKIGLEFIEKHHYPLTSTGEKSLLNEIATLLRPDGLAMAPIPGSSKILIKYCRDVVGLFGVPQNSRGAVLEVLQDLLQRADSHRVRTHKPRVTPGAIDKDQLQRDLSKRLARFSKEKPLHPQDLDAELRLLTMETGLQGSLDELLRERLCRDLANCVNPIVDPACDVVVALLNQLKVRRLLTLNYDVEIEKCITAGLQSLRGASSENFRDLANHPIGSRQRREHGALHVPFVTGTQRVALSTALDDSTIGELVNFGAYSQAYDKQVFHLHGRLDAPKEIVLTQKDYLKLYVRDEAASRGFDETMEALFGGNDLLFIGVGMSEADVMRPLRQFAARQMTRNHEPHRIFALLPSSYSKSADRDNAQFAISLRTNYGVYALFYGETDEFRSAMERIDGFRRQLNDAASIAFEIDRGSSGEDERALQAQLSLLLSSADGLTGDPLFPTVWSKWPEAVATILSSGTWDDRVAAFSNARRLLDEARSLNMSTALCAKLMKLNDQRAKWWNDWRTDPTPRQARFHVASEGVAGKENYLWVRHLANYRWSWLEPRSTNMGYRLASKPLNDVLRFDPIADALEEGRKAPVATGKSRRTIRFAIPRGGGSGSFIALLQHIDIHSRLFPSEGDGSKPVEYEAAFFGSSTF